MAPVRLEMVLSWKQLRRLAKRIREAPREVVAFRAAQALRCWLLRVTGGWARLERRSVQWWSDSRVRRFLARPSDNPSPVSRDALEALGRASKTGRLDADGVVRRARAVAGRRFSVLGTPVPRRGRLPFHRDWLHDHTWDNQYFSDYRFYEREKSAPYDVKRPWEVSRFSYLLNLIQGGVFDTIEDRARQATDILEDWSRSNPLAYSVNWHPMEASVRGITLVMALEMLLACGERRSAVVAPWLRQITTHGAFVWRTREYSDVTGNHYAANVVFLLLAGTLLREYVPEARRWLRLAVQEIPRQIEGQFLSDGVNFEKSVSYHRLVVELFLLAAVVLERSGNPLSGGTRERLHRACWYLAVCRRPDGALPLVGDSDDATVLPLDHDGTPTADAALSSAALFFNDGRIKAAAGGLTATILWLFGSRGVGQWDELSEESVRGVHHFANGGVIVAHFDDDYLWLDVGEVGLDGRGGHGHNDLLSFELAFAGKPVVVDPGSYVYTADPEARDLFRSTSYHNTVSVDGEELAPLRGFWRIGNEAEPREVVLREEGDSLELTAAQTGYERLPDPVTHRRRICFSSRLGLICQDAFESSSKHTVQRFLHFDHGIEVEVDGRRASCTSMGRRWLVTWDASSTARVVKGWVSPSYGQRFPAWILELTTEIEGSAELSMEISKLAGTT